MRSTARVVVIGGGVVGVSTLYHLAKKGWSDVVLIERKELTSGSTWHAAGLLPLVQHELLGRPDAPLLGRASTGSSRPRPARMSASSRSPTSASPAQKDRWDEFMYYAGVAETIGVKVNVLTPAEVKEIWPLCETDGILGAIQHPDDGYIQPADLTQALAKGARALGAEINRNTTVTGDRADARRRVAGQDRQGRHHLRARRLGDRQFRPPDRRDGRPRRPGHPGRAPVHRHRAASGDPGAPEAGPAGDGRAARGGFVLVHARGEWRPAARPLREGRALLLRRRARTPTPNTSSSRRISTGWRRISRRRSRACPPSARSASRRSITAPSPIRRTARRSSARPGTCRISG